MRSGSSDQRYYIHLPDGTLLAAVDAVSNARRFYHFDENGSTSFLTDDAGAVSDTWVLTPYGETISRTGSTENPFTFQGAFGITQEGATGLYYMRARYYDSTSARFLSKDPVLALDPREVNPYQYAMANPLEERDPTGLFPRGYGQETLLSGVDLSHLQGLLYGARPILKFNPDGAFFLPRQRTMNPSYFSFDYDGFFTPWNQSSRNLFFGYQGDTDVRSPRVSLSLGQTYYWPFQFDRIRTNDNWRHSHSQEWGAGRQPVFAGAQTFDACYGLQGGRTISCTVENPLIGKQCQQVACQSSHFCDPHNIYKFPPGLLFLIALGVVVHLKSRSARGRGRRR